MPGLSVQEGVYISVDMTFGLFVQEGALNSVQYMYTVCMHAVRGVRDVYGSMVYWIFVAFAEPYISTICIARAFDRARMAVTPIAIGLRGPCCVLSV